MINKKSMLKLAKTSVFWYIISFVLMTIILSFISISEQQQPILTRTENTEKICTGNNCNLIVYSGNKFIETAEGNNNWTNFWNAVKITRSEDIFNVSWHNRWFTFRPYFVRNGINYTWQQVKNIYPEVSIDFYKTDYEDYTKWGFNLSNPNNRTFDYLDIRVEEVNGVTWDDVRKEEGKITIKNKITLNFNDIKKQGYNITLLENRIARIGNVSGKLIIDIDPTIKLDSGNDTADGYVTDSGTPEMNRIHMKWDLNSIPTSSTIDDALLCLFIFDTMGDGIDNDVNISRFRNQTWTEAAAPLNPAFLNTTIDKTWSSISPSTWSCINITLQVQESYNEGEKNLSLKLEDPDNMLIGTNLFEDNYQLYFGDGGFSGGAIFDDREGGNTPYLNVSYTEGGEGGDTTLPIVYLKIPANATNSTTATQYFSANFTDNIQLKNTTLYIWNSTYSLIYSNTTDITGTFNTTNISYTFITYDTYKWNYKAYDNSSNSAWYSANWTFIYSAASDTTYPIFSDYWDDNASLVGSGIGKFNVTVENTNGTIMLNLNGVSVKATNLTSNIYNASYTFSLPGTYLYNWSAYGNGTSNNLNISQNKYYTVNATFDTTPPNINITYPLNISYNINVSNLNYTVSDETGLSNCWYSRDSGATNLSIVPAGANFTNVTSVENSNAWIVYCNDTSNNINSSSVIFYKDTTYPLISYGIGTENNGANVTRNWIYVNVSVTETNFANITFILRNSTDLVNSTTYTTATYTTNWTNLAYTNYIYNVSIYDIVGNFNSTETRTINLSYIPDTTPPLISFINPTPLNATTTSNTTIQINVSVIEGSLGEIKFNWNTTSFTIYNDNLVLMFNFENLSSLGENSTHVADLSEYNNNGTAMNGTVWTSSGKYGGAYNFNGINNSIGIPASSVFDISGTSPISMGLWIKTSQTPDSGKVAIPIMITETGQGSGTFDKGIIFSNAGKISFYVWDGASETAYSNAIINDNTWYYVVGIFNETDVLIYVNGKFENSSSASNTYDFASPEIVLGFVSTTASHNLFNGTIDEVRIWNRSLSAAEINQLYMSNLYKHNQTQWYLYVNQSKNSTAGLDIGTYTYQAYAKDTSGNTNSTETRTIIINATITTSKIGLSLIYPVTNINVTQNQFFNVTVNVSCYDADCGEINVSSVFNTSILILTTTGATPFYTNESNPRNISLNINESQLVTFWVNATGSIGNTYEFFVYANKTSDMSINNITNKWNVTITDMPPVVSLNTPTINYNSINLREEIIFNCSATDDMELKNISLYTNLNNTWQLFETKIITGVYNYSVFSVNLSDFIGKSIIDKTFNWNCLVYDNKSQSSWAAENYSFSGWDLGSYNNTIYNNLSKAVMLIANSSGHYISNAKEIEYVASWKNLSWQQGVNNQSNISIFLRSCNYPYCSGVSNWDIACVNSSYCNLSSLNNSKFIQYKINFETTNTSYSPKIYNITINYDYASNIDLRLHGLQSNWSIEAGNYVNITAELIYPNQENISVYINSDSTYNGSSPYSNYTQFNQAGLYNITAIYEGDDIYPEDSETFWLSVNTTFSPEAKNYTYISGIGRIDEEGNIEYFITDEEGVKAIVDEQGNVLWSIDYKWNGKPLYQKGNTSEVVGWLGMIWNEETGMYIRR